MRLMADPRVLMAWKELMRTANQVQSVSDMRRLWLVTKAEALYEQAGKVEIPEEPLVSENFNGAWVQAWVWVPNSANKRADY